MSHIKNILITIATLFLMSSAFAAENNKSSKQVQTQGQAAQQNGANDFTVNGQPINALCIYLAIETKDLKPGSKNMVDADDVKEKGSNFDDKAFFSSIFINHELPMGAPGQIDVKKCQTNPTTGDMTDTTFEFQTKLIDQNQGFDQYSPRGEANYKFVGKIDPSLYVLHYTINGGGTGTFDSIQIVKYENGMLQSLKSISGGDRTIGTFDKLELKGNKLYYTQNACNNSLHDLSGPQTKGVIEITPSLLNGTTSDGIPGCN